MLSPVKGENEKMNIIINRGDEYRAKIEREVDADSIFSPVYRKAQGCVEEIEKETRQYLQKEFNTDSLYRGFGNNIISFCGNRGEGKTSAMVSFTEQLKKEAGSKYEIMTPIDPSMFSESDSIVMVMLSYMFKRCEKVYDERITKDQGRTDIRIIDDEKRELLKAFKRCYRNVINIHNKEFKEDEIDQLERLAQLGDSTELRCNLGELVRLYLNFLGLDRKEAYLVVQIDDTDLAESRTYEICEDIRRYIKIPRVIILMAMSFETLETTMLEERGQKCKDTDLVKFNTNRYLEKMFPKGHRIDIPNLNWMMQSYSRNLSLKYMDVKQNCNLFDELFESESLNFQQVLLKMLYMRTGVILIPKDGEIHPFIPHTMRELTHFTKLLYDMKQVNIEDIYNISTLEEKDNVERIKSNLNILKEYFIEMWCPNNLNSEDNSFLKKVDIACKKYDLQELVKIFAISKKKNDNKITYRKILTSKVFEEGEKPSLKKAVQLYFDFFVNEWFLEVLDESMKQNILQIFMRDSMHASEKLSNKKLKKKYKLVQFEIDFSELKSWLPSEKIKKDSVDWINCFYQTNGFELIEKDPEMTDHYIWNLDVEETAKVSFDLFNSFQYAVFTQNIWNRLTKSTYEEISDSVSESSPSEEKEFSDQTALIGIKNIVFNFEVQDYIFAGLDNEYKYLERRTKTVGTQAEFVEEIFGKVDDIYNNTLSFLNLKSDCHKLIDFFDNKSYAIAATFLANPENVSSYKKEYAEYTKDTAEELIKILDDMPSDLKDSKAVASTSGMPITKQRIIEAISHKEQEMKKSVPLIIDVPSEILNDKIPDVYNNSKGLQEVIDALKKVDLSDQEKENNKKKLTHIISESENLLKRMDDKTDVKGTEKLTKRKNGS